jgi:hypothetical protein
MYGWMEGYGMLFDPAVYLRTGIIPEWENGLSKKRGAGDFIITSCAQASALFDALDIPGIYVRPSRIPGIIASRKSEKERLTTPGGSLFYPIHLPYEQYEGEAAAWVLGESPAIRKLGKSLAVGFEIFAMCGAYRSELPEEIFLQGADMAAGLLEECGAAGSKPARKVFPRDIRMDCQAYGVNRLLLQWFLEIKGRDRNAVRVADESYRKSMEAMHSAGKKEVLRHLVQAFGHLAELRKSLSAMELHFLEYPHLGILFEDKGFFELEWPHYTRKLFLSYIEQIQKHGYKVSIENGGFCWKTLAARYPRLAETIAKLWREGAIELTNGTYSLPYALVSSLALQYWQFQKGHEDFKEVFGKTPSVYQCQENSLTPQMPELLRHFGYERALHITQNHGEAPAEPTDFIQWASPAGHSIFSMATRHPAIARKGENYFLDLPLIHEEFGGTEKSLNYVNFQDIGYVPFRMHMIRAHKHAPVWGEFQLDKECFKSAPEDAPLKTYTADAYNFSKTFFYRNGTNVNPFSHYEAIHALSARVRQLRMAGCSSGQRAKAYRILDHCVGQLCRLEAHDCCYCQGQRRGEFYSKLNSEVPPYSRENLTQKVREMTSGTAADLDRAWKMLAPGKSSRKLFNASEVPLAFGRIQSPGSCHGGNAVKRGADLYARGPFPAFSSCEPAASGNVVRKAALPLDNGLWRIEIDKHGKLLLAFKGQKISCIPVDKKKGAFELLSSQLERAGGLNFLTLRYQQGERNVQSVILDLVFAGQGDYAEINVNYTPRNDFSVESKWDDCLALEMHADSALGKVWRFNPNVRAVTHEDRTVSPYYIAAESSDGSCFSLMNDGASLYELDRKKGDIRWLFHVFGESVFNRRMGIVIGRSDVFQLSRAWGQGLLNMAPDILPLLKNVDWQGVSLEDFVAQDTLLVSNLAGEKRELKIDKGLFSSAKNLLGRSVAGNSHLKLEPMELALIRAARKPKAP